MSVADGGLVSLWKHNGSSYTLRTPRYSKPQQLFEGMCICSDFGAAERLVGIALGKAWEGGGSGCFLGWYRCFRALGVGFMHGFQRRLSEFKSWFVCFDPGEFR